MKHNRLQLPVGCYSNNVWANLSRSDCSTLGGNHREMGRLRWRIIDAFTVSLHSPNGMHLLLVRAVQGDSGFWKTVETPTSLTPTVTEGYPNLYLDQPIPIGGHVWQSFGHQTSTVQPSRRTTDWQSRTQPSWLVAANETQCPYSLNQWHGCQPSKRNTMLPIQRGFPVCALSSTH